MNNKELQKFSNFVIFQTESGKVNIDVYFQNETLWLTQKKMSELFEVNIPSISKHLKNIFETGELLPMKRYISDFDLEVQKLLEEDKPKF